ncbi:hypothetical protein [Gryllotalpicola protaetiae]|uniref:DUF4232 domain-containing protein n=1 Tax=Gryllotalpicola protaetiae TaxID=2419771 RepID=A0A387BPY4_9MICO|nr:hypothetical protein [Gryllotalpicola protaetiae]AYG03080.1 hypothetical protein D7I44_05755 [Gryllotalpicola protaetiae]
MSTQHHPVGRRSAAVYRRRRFVVLLVLLAIVAGVLFLVFRPGSGGAATAGGRPTTPAAASQTPQPTGSGTSLPGPSSSARPAATPKATPAAAGQPCAHGNIDVEAITDASSYKSGAQPLLSLSLTNTGSVMCTIDAGTATMVFTVTSGKEPYWTSTDCQSNPVHTDIKLEPKQTLTSTPIAWDRTRSSTSTCGGPRPAAPAGGASYHLSVSVAGIASATSKQFLLY